MTDRITFTESSAIKSQKPEPGTLYVWNPGAIYVALGCQ